MVGKKNIVCQVCKRHFKTSAALAQHKMASHGNVQMAVPRSRPRQRPRKTVQASALRKNRAFGSDIIATFMVGAGSRVGKLLFAKMISPLTMTGTRFCEEGQLWTRWRPIRLHARLELSGASTTFGSIIFGWTGDSSPDMSGNDMDIIRRVGTFRPQKVSRLNQGVSFNIPVETARKWLQTTGDADQTAQGCLIAVVSGQTGGYSGAVTMMLSLEWEVEFESPTLGSSSATPGQTITPDSGWTQLFTTSDGSFDATRLTFKMHHGGDMVPFSAAGPGTVYTVADATRVTYYDETGKQIVCRYFARVQGYSVPGFLLFSSYADARAYITTGDVTKALVYNKAGDEVTPAIPTFKPITQVELASLGHESDLERRVNQLTTLVEALVLQGQATRSATTDALTHQAVKTLESKIDRALRPLKVSLDRGTLGSPLVTFSEDPVRTSRNLSQRKDSEETSDYEAV